MDIFLGLAIPIIALLLTVAGAYFIANAVCQRNWKEKVPQSKLIGFTCAFAVSFTALIFFFQYKLEFWGGPLAIVLACIIATLICRNCWKEKIPYPKLIGFTAAYAASFTLLAFLMMMAAMMTFGR